MNKKVGGRFASGMMTLGMLFAAAQVAATTTVEVYKSPTCGCCAKWVDHMRDNGFADIGLPDAHGAEAV